MKWHMADWIRAACLILLMVMTAPEGLRAEVSVSATLDRATIGVDDEAELTIRVNGARSADIEIPEVDGLTISRRGQSSQLSMINGNITSSITVNYALSAAKVGSFTIPPITVHAGDHKLSTEALPLVVSDDQGEAGSIGGKKDLDEEGEPQEKAFIEISGLKEKLYIGETIPVRINAYFRQGLRANLNSYPSLAGDGCVIPQLNKEPVQSRTTLNGVGYTLLTWDTQLTTIKEGKHQLRLGLDATLLVAKRRLSTSMFSQQSPFEDEFFEGVFGGYQQKKLHLTTKDLAVTVVALPTEERPADFSGAVGDFSFQVAAKPLSVGPGEPINLTMTISGKGNFDRVEAPPFPGGDDWKTYPPSSKLAIDKDTLSGKKTFEQALIVKNHQITEIPALRLSYFDPDKGQYITKTTEPIAIKFTGGSPAPPQPSVAPPVSEPLPTEAKPTPTDSLADLAPLQLELGEPLRRITPPFAQPWFIILVVCCLLCLIALAVMATIRHRRRDSDDERRRQLRQVVDEGLVAMSQASAAQDGAAFLAEARKLLQRRLGAAWQIEPSAITQADIRQRLPEAKVVLEIIAAAEQAAYGGAILSPQQMEMYTTALGQELESLP